MIRAGIPPADYAVAPLDGAAGRRGQQARGDPAPSVFTDAFSTGRMMSQVVLVSPQAWG
jgi:hypothetical protein